MPALSREATRYMIMASGQLQVQLREVAMRHAEQQGEVEISAEHIEFALRQLAGDNSSLLESLLPRGNWGIVDAARRAG